MVDADAKMEADGVDIMSTEKLRGNVLNLFLKCKNHYRQRKALDVHVSTSGRPEPEKTVLVRGAAMSLNMLHEHNLGLHKVHFFILTFRT